MDNILKVKMIAQCVGNIHKSDKKSYNALKSKVALAAYFDEYQEERTKHQIFESETVADLVELADTYSFILEQNISHYQEVICVENVEKDNFVLNEKGELKILHPELFRQACFIEDFGKLFQYYVPPVKAHETNLLLVKIREEYFEALVEGYLSAMRNNLKEEDVKAMIFASKYVVYLSAIHYLNSYLHEPIGTNKHYLECTLNQFALLHQIFHKEDLLQSIIDKALKIKY